MRTRTELGITTWLLVSTGAVAFLAGCGSDDAKHPTSAALVGCAECHSDAERLQATADPDDGPPPENTGDT
ncbi:MAG: hypothetical protein R3E12_05560 [Candidatus Eisenbacteria bacterium]|uniref:Cytochrome c domain-containing protein n=1 Tax=Eiseniibacteriota bacterium TaxID=2212470 RepID=A0A956LW39_UNCEI|nr:hypothetical protein [Candidatus Eisenbacteria bacterium]